MRERIELARAAQIGLAAITVLAGACGEAREEEAVELGRLIFETNHGSSAGLNAYRCATCHRATSDAQDDRILPGAVLAGAHERPTFWQGQERDLLRAINYCRQYFMSAPEPWTAESEPARALYAYILSLSPPVKEPVPFTVVADIADLPPGDPALGGEVYRRACRSCHGDAHTAAGRQVPQAPLLPEQTLAAHPDYTPLNKRLVFVEKARHGVFLGYAGTMPPFSREVLSDQQMAALLAFLGVY
jgi:thiosulfate dehydrogenase